MRANTRAIPILSFATLSANTLSGQFSNSQSAGDTTVVSLAGRKNRRDGFASTTFSYSPGNIPLLARDNNSALSCPSTGTFLRRRSTLLPGTPEEQA